MKNKVPQGAEEVRLETEKCLECRQALGNERFTSGVVIASDFPDGGISIIRAFCCFSHITMYTTRHKNFEPWKKWMGVRNCS